MFGGEIKRKINRDGENGGEKEREIKREGYSNKIRGWREREEGRETIYERVDILRE